jgi:hypothetical protein
LFVFLLCCVGALIFEMIINGRISGLWISPPRGEGRGERGERREDEGEMGLMGSEVLFIELGSLGKIG